MLHSPFSKNLIYNTTRGFSGITIDSVNISGGVLILIFTNRATRLKGFVITRLDSKTLNHREWHIQFILHF